MILLTPQSNCQNAAQAAPRIALLTDGPNRCFLGRRLPTLLEALDKTANRNALGLPGANKPMTPTAIPGSLHVPDAARENTFRKGSRLVFNFPEILGKFGRGCVQPRNAKNAGELL